MKKLISEQFAIRGLLLIIGLFIIFHILILTGIVPFNIVWGGRLKNYSEMISFEFVSIGINLIMFFAVAIKAKWFKFKLNNTFLKIVFWLMFGLFTLNTLGNLASENSFEKAFFTPITILLAFFSLRLSLTKN